MHTLAWDKVLEELYIGGNFDSIGSNSVSSGLAVWSSKDGLRGLPCSPSTGMCSGGNGIEGGSGSWSGIRQSSAHVTGTAISIAFEPVSKVRTSVSSGKL